MKIRIHTYLTFIFALFIFLNLAGIVSVYADTSDDHEHTYESYVTAPDCGNDGYTTYICTECGDTYTADETSATGNHTAGDAVQENVIAASCTEGGSYESVVYCSVCGEELSRVTVETDAKGHSYNGTNVCSVCGSLRSSSISDANISLTSDKTIVYSGTEKKPSVTVVINGTVLEAGTDYTVSYSDNVTAGTAVAVIEGTGGYSGSKKLEFEIVQKTISSTASAANVTLSKSTYTYSGTAKKPTPTVKITLNGSTKTLKKGTDYSVSYKNNTSAGTATVVITGTGNYKGTLKKTFTINKKSIASTSSAAKVTLSKTSYTYNGKAKKPSVKLKITLNGSTKTLKKNTNYTVSYSNNKKVGTATVTIKGTGNYKGTIKKTFKIKPKSTSLSSLTSISKGFTAKWKTVSTQVSGYQIQYATNKSFTKGKGTVTVSGKTTKTESVTSVNASTKYYVRIRTYKTVNGVKYYSSWSSAKTVKTGKRVTMFGGDSLTIGIKLYGDSAMSISGTVKYACYTSLNTKTFRTTKTGDGRTCVQKVIDEQPYRFYIMLGMNEVTWKDPDDVLADWISLIKYIQKNCPTTDIVVLSMTPVSASTAAKKTGFKKIDQYNAIVQEAAETCGVTYYDFTASFKNSSGYLKSKYNGGDGIHMSRAGYQHIAEVISEFDATLE